MNKIQARLFEACQTKFDALLTSLGDAENGDCEKPSDSLKSLATCINDKCQ